MRVKLLFHKLIRKFGLDFRRYSADNYFELKRIKIINKNEINIVLDIGASEGLYAQELRELGYKKKIISFEPLKKSFEKLQHLAKSDSVWEAYNVALGDNFGEVEMSVSGHVTSSSLLPMTEIHINALSESETVSKEKIQVRTLNSYLGNEIKANDNIYMKVDVQGFEMFVLSGAKDVLPQIKAIEIELSLVQLYQGGPLFLEMISYLASLGFALVSFNHVFSDPKTDLLLQVDGIFTRIRD